MKVAWLGHHCYRIMSDSGLTIITDPYRSPLGPRPGIELKYDPLDETADIVVVSHEHSDHNNAEAIRGNPEVVRGSEIRGSSKKVKGIEFKALACYHDNVQGQMHGENNILSFELDGMIICHNGDQGHELTADQAAELGKVDILLLAVTYMHEVNTQWADILYEQLKPRVTLPGHYHSHKCTFPMATVDQFLEGKANVVRLDEKSISEVEFKKDEISEATQIIVLKSKY